MSPRGGKPARQACIGRARRLRTCTYSACTRRRKGRGPSRSSRRRRASDRHMWSTSRYPHSRRAGCRILHPARRRSWGRTSCSRTSRRCRPYQRSHPPRSFRRSLRYQRLQLPRRCPPRPLNPPRPLIPPRPRRLPRLLSQRRRLSRPSLRRYRRRRQRSCRPLRRLHPGTSRRLGSRSTADHRDPRWSHSRRTKRTTTRRPNGSEHA